MVFKPKRQYSWNDDYKLSIDPNIVGGVLEKLEEEKGKVTADDFLDFSRPEDSPTHSIFEWDDTKAAELWRHQQSRTTINALRIEYTNTNSEQVKVSAFIRTNPTGSRTAYENIHSALTEKEKREIVLKRIQAELDSFIIRNRHIEELADMLEASAKKLRGEK